MDIQTLSYLVIGLMALAIGIVTFARAKTSGWLRFILVGIAFLFMIPAFFGMLIVVFRIQ